MPAVADPLQGCCILLHGAPKSGKTTLASSFPGPIQWIATEPGHKYIPEGQKKGLLRLTMGQKKAKGRRVPFQNGWDELKAFLEEGILRKRHPKTVVIDTVSNLYEMAFMFYCEQQGIEHPADQTHGKGWAGVKREFMRGVGVLLEQCELMGTTVVLIAHSKNEEFDAGSRKYTRIRVDLPGQARSVVVPVPDHIWYLGIHTDSGEDSLTHFHGNRALWMQPTAIVEAGGQDKTIDTVTMISPLNKSGQYQQILDYIAEARRKNDDG